MTAIAAATTSIVLATTSMAAAMLIAEPSHVAPSSSQRVAQA
jgi:hypothetical protein